MHAHGQRIRHNEGQDECRGRIPWEAGPPRQRSARSTGFFGLVGVNREAYSLALTVFHGQYEGSCGRPVPDAHRRPDDDLGELPAREVDHGGRFALVHLVVRGDFEAGVDRSSQRRLSWISEAQYRGGSVLLRTPKGGGPRWLAGAKS